MYDSILEEGMEVDYPVLAGCYVWLQVVCGAINVNEVRLGEGDGAAISDEALLKILAKKDSQFLLFNLG